MRVEIWSENGWPVFYSLRSHQFGDCWDFEETPFILIESGQDKLWNWISDFKNNFFFEEFRMYLYIFFLFIAILRIHSIKDVVTLLKIVTFWSQNKMFMIGSYISPLKWNSEEKSSEWDQCLLSIIKAFKILGPW